MFRSNRLTNDGLRFSVSKDYSGELSGSHFHSTTKVLRVVHLSSIQSAGYRRHELGNEDPVIDQIEGSNPSQIFATTFNFL